MRAIQYLRGFHPNSRKNLRPRFTTANSTGRPRSYALAYYQAIHARRLAGDGKRRIARAMGCSASLVQCVRRWALAGTLDHGRKGDD